MSFRSLLSLRPWLVLLLLLSLGGSLLWARNDLDNSDTRWPERQYRRFLLPNGMKVILISDPTMQRSAASLAVGVGSLMDPRDRQGLAHFLEHMLFLGTEKYPTPGSYQEFVSTNDGFTNAFTSEEMTNYHFEIAPDAFEEGLDRFSQFFTAPLFNQELVDREIRAVDSEHSKNIPNDFRRVFQVEREAYEPGHPARHFSTGNLDTLGGVSREELLRFYRTQYSANRMTLAVASRHSLDTLQRWVVPRFVLVANRNLPEWNVPGEFMAPDPNFRLMQVKTVKDARSLTLKFALPPTINYYASRPLGLIGSMLGHEGENSLLSLLKRENLATGLSAGGGGSNRSYSSFNLNIQLTERGQQNYRQVITYVFQAIELLRRKGLPRHVFEENQRMAEIELTFMNRSEGTSLTNMFASMMQFYPLKEVERAPFLLTEYNPKLFDSMLFRLTPDNMLAILAARDVETDTKEPYYGTEYSFTKSHPEWVKEWARPGLNAAIQLPEPNPFLPENLALQPFRGGFQLTHSSLVGLEAEGLPEPLMARLRQVEGREWGSWDSLMATLELETLEVDRRGLQELLKKHALPTPVKILDAERGQVWFQQDYRFDSPKAQLHFRIETPEVYASPRNAVLSQLYADAFEEGLNEFTYPALTAGLSYNVWSDKKGIRLSFSGYSDRILTFVQAISTKLKTLEVDEKTFAELKERKRRSYTNFHLQQPYQQAFYYRSLLLENRKFALWDYEKELASITLKELREYAQKRLYARTFLQGVAYGNLEGSEVRTAVNELLQTLGGEPLPEADRYVESIRQIPSGTAYTLSQPVEVNNSALVMELQVAQRTPQNQVALQVLSTALQPQAYNELRTNQQLGYIVNASMTEAEDTLGLVFLVQSGTYGPAELEARVRAFFPQFLKQVQQMPEAQFQALKGAVRNGMLDKPDSVSAVAGMLFGRAFERQAEFDPTSPDLRALEALQLQDLQDLVAQLGESQQRRLSLRMIGQGHQDGPVDGVQLSDVAAFRKALTCPDACLP